MIQETIKRVLLLVEQNQYDKAFNLLQPLVDKRNPSLCLYSGDILHKFDKERAYSYLEEKSKEGFVGALHRSVLLKKFFNPSSLLSLQDLKRLEQDSLNGNIESSIVLYLIHENDNRQNDYVSRLQSISSDLIADLGVCITDVSKRCSDDELLFRLNNENKRYDCHRLDDNINLLHYKSVFPEVLCNYITLRTEAFLKPAMIVDPVTGEAKSHPIRKSFYAQVSPEMMDWMFLSVDSILENLSKVSRLCGEPLAVMKYEHLHQYKPHFDAIINPDGSSPAEREGGQRIKTLICGLAAAKEGGLTAFPRLKKEIKISKGDVLAFDNIDAQKSILQESYHAGLPIISGEKWVMTKWLREKHTEYGRMLYGA